MRCRRSCNPWGVVRSTGARPRRARSDQVGVSTAVMGAVWWRRYWRSSRISMGLLGSRGRWSWLFRSDPQDVPRYELGYVFVVCWFHKADVGHAINLEGLRDDVPLDRGRQWLFSHEAQQHDGDEDQIGRASCRERV